ncbi:hypothetical protein KGF57_004291 [Candida theae]|uniref:Uncharacterized protein n=1 Tax=Candida theae TaxID=1198502 RepID=A0AAD5BBX9_9ASCO|nr:uncharacterized protein KGF57_004291 [Candida theae]KAI5950476.1 hypothetical protein KGF57_004291 [Candida theae]
MKTSSLALVMVFAIHSVAGSAITGAWHEITLSSRRVKSWNDTSSGVNVTIAPASNETASATVQDPGLNNTQLAILLLSLQDYNAHNLEPSFAMDKKRRSDVFDLLEKRSDLPLLDTILSTLNNTGVALTVIDYVLLRPELLDIVIQTTIWVIRLRLINLADLIIALQRSNLIMDVLTLGLEDSEILPGLINITIEILKQSGLDLGLLSKRFDVEPVQPFNSTVDHLSKRENALLDQLFLSLRDSGLAVSVVKHLLTTPALASPNAHFLVSILQSHALTLSDLLAALKESNLIWDLVRQLLGDPSIIIEFGGTIVQRVAQGLIPKELITG